MSGRCVHGGGRQGGRRGHHLSGGERGVILGRADDLGKAPDGDAASRSAGRAADHRDRRASTALGPALTGVPRWLPVAGWA